MAITADGILDAIGLVNDETSPSSGQAVSLLKDLKYTPSPISTVQVAQILSLAPLDEAAFESLLDDWFERDVLPLDGIKVLLEMLECGENRGTEQLYRCMMPGMTHLAIYLLMLTPRLPSNAPGVENMVSAVHAIVNSFRSNDLPHVLGTLIHLSEELEHLDADSLGWKLLGDSQVDPVSLPVNRVLDKIAVESPSSMSQFKEALIRRITGDVPMSLATSKDVCSLLVTSLGDDTAHLLSTIHKLLFLSTGSHSLVLSNNPAHTLRGVMLATKFVSSNNFESDAINKVYDWVQRIMLPTTRRMVPPEVGRQCLVFIQSMGTDKTANVSDKVKQMLGNTGLVQKLSQYESSGRLRGKIQAFGKIPDEFTSNGGKRHNVVLCVDYFVQKARIQDATRWKVCFHWVAELVSAYLELARTTSGIQWSAESWLQAPLAFAPVTLEGSETVRLLQDDLNDFSLVRWLCESIDNELVRKAVSELAQTRHSDLIEALVNHAFSVHVGLALSLTTLNHAFDQKEAVGALNGDSLSHLCVFQVMKVMYLKMKTRPVLSLFRQLVSSLNASNRKGVKRKRASTHRKTQQTLRDDTYERERLENIIESLHWVENLDIFRFISASSLFFAAENGVTKQSVKRIIEKANGTPIRISQLEVAMVAMKTSIFKELANPRRPLDPIVCRKPQLIEFLVKGLSEVTCILHLRTSTTPAKQNNQHILSNHLLQLSVAHISLLIRLVDHKGIDINFPSLFEDIASQLGRTQDLGLATSQMELLSCLSLHDGKNCLEKAIQLNWTVLHTVFSSNLMENAVTSSYIIRRDQAKYSSVRSSPRASFLHGLTRIRGSKAFSPYRMALLRHVGLLSCSPGALSTCCSHLAELLRELQSFASDVDASIRGVKVDNGDAKKSQRRALAPSSLPFLTSSSLPDYFEALLTMTIYMLTLSQPALPLDAGENESPYSLFVFLLQMFRHLLKVYEEYHAVFPHTVARVLVELSGQMLEALVSQLHGCVDWRNQQPILRPAQRVKEVDYGSILFLESLVNESILPLLGDLYSLCDFYIDKAEGPWFPFKNTKLHANTARADRQIQQVVVQYNMMSSHPNHQQELSKTLPPLIPVKNVPRAGFPLVRPNDPAETKASAGDDLVDTSESEQSGFGVSGEWKDSDEESITSVEMKTTLVKRS